MQLNIEDDEFKKTSYCPSHKLDNLKPGEFDLNRMKQALESEMITLPQGLSKGEVRQFLINSMKS